MNRDLGVAVAPTTLRRLGVAALFSVVAGAVAWRAQHLPNVHGADYHVIWQGARLVLSGHDPYQLTAAGEAPALAERFFYPLPGVAMGLPFAWLSQGTAAIAFVIVSSALLGFVVTAVDFNRVPIVLSLPFVATAHLAQTSFLILALGLTSLGLGLTVMKPNLGLALFARCPNWNAAIIGGVVLVASVVVAPSWPAHWLVVVRSLPVQHHAPMVTGIGAVGLLAALRWRRPEARLLFALTIIPHSLYFYDDVALWLVAQSRREAMALSFLSWIGAFGWLATSHRSAPRITEAPPWVVASLYLPAVIMVLRRPNEGDLPVWLDAALSRAPSWLRGQPARG